MRPISIFALTRVESEASLQRFERQLSGRSGRLNIKKWEVDCLCRFSDRLCRAFGGGGEFLKFFYSFQIPKLGKEFDLLRISEDVVVNVELKSDPVPEDKIRGQLLLNRYYLGSLERTVRSYTYVSSEDRLLRLTNSEKLVESDWESLCEDLRRQGACFEGDVESLFREEDYLVSPLTDPERFLRQDYFLTSQQRDIRRHILYDDENKRLFQGFTGIPGTGKTLLLYSIAMQLSDRQRVCVLHYGSYPTELEHLNERLKRIDFVAVRNSGFPALEGYAAILVDEGHRMPKEDLERLKLFGEQNQVPVIFSYDREDFVAAEERGVDMAALIRELPDYKEYRITNRIRTNSELASFIRRLMQVTDGFHRTSFPSVSVLYANNVHESKLLLEEFRNNEFVYIYDESLTDNWISDEGCIEAKAATCREFDKVVMLVDESFYYDEAGYLRSGKTKEEHYPVYNLFHGLSRAKYRLGLVIRDNPEVFDRILSIITDFIYK